ncbi:beta-mannosidase-like protein [Heterostelium album PN500]|uniref:beta-mannosidase n=1 Tax=Heterostelium pallidum (strain ATCC 26659 / Pp 5 / PN500) TaxID=670386 RepID=D3AWY5_HETP5|nr:beta-mannosidase-like protein [Heterostelium album PN500]EFA86808.1 beta-mannosidase-like protein [Heterostelium album PN500]|eukprot:XP_020438911.1 beta-mannosidase-like protein [Heterostelium album PN500]
MKIIEFDKLEWKLTQLNRRNLVVNGNGQDYTDGNEQLIELNNVHIPTDVHLSLMNNKVIPDLYVGEKELEYRWISLSDWQFSTTFQLDQHTIDQALQIDLVCESIDTIATIIINERVVANVENQFRLYRFNVSSFLKVGTNRIEINIYSPAVYCKKKAAECSYEIPLWEYPNGIHHRNFIRKNGCHFGWDWGPCFCPMGIEKPIRLEVMAKEITIRNLLVEQKHLENNRVELELTIDIFAPTAITTPSVWSIEVVEYSNENNSPIQKIDQPTVAFVTDSTAYGHSKLHANKILFNPKLWYPAGYGKQFLYELLVYRDSEVLAKRRIGIRNMKIDTSDGQLTIVVNGQRIFARGADWIPADTFLTRISEKRLRALLTSTAAANMNCLRVWGGGIYESASFYNLCDELGILIWQDFMFACALYPSNKEFLDNVKHEVEDQIHRIGHHPSIALWCGNNENEQALAVWKPSKDNPPRYIIDYSKLYIETIMPSLQRMKPSAFFLPSSPTNGVNQWGDPNEDGRGDQHCWLVWHSNKPFTEYLKVKSRFLSEFGFQSLPREAALRQVVGEDQLNITSPEMEGRQRSPTPGNNGLLQHTALHFRVPNSFKNLCYTTQVLQAISIKTGCEHWRRLSPYCMGTLYWQLNDIWVGPSWSSIEFDGTWKALHYFATRFYNPLLLSMFVNEQSEVEAWITNDSNISYECNLHLEMWNVANAQKTYESVEQVKSTEFTNGKVNTVKVSDLFNNCCKPDAYGRQNQFLYAYMEKDGKKLADNTYFFGPYKYLNLKPSGVTIKSIQTIEQSRVSTIEIETKEIALFVWVEASVAGRFSDNGFLLFKSESKSIEFYPDYTNNNDLNQNDKPLEFKVYSLYESYN